MKSLVSFVFISADMCLASGAFSGCPYILRTKSCMLYQELYLFRMSTEGKIGSCSQRTREFAMCRRSENYQLPKKMLLLWVKLASK